MTVWTGFKQQNSASDETIGSNEEEDGIAMSVDVIGLDIVNCMHLRFCFLAYLTCSSSRHHHHHLQNPEIVFFGDFKLK